jgi:hypothetical protein
MTYCVHLTIQPFPDKDDADRDRVRIPVVRRPKIGEGRVCKLSVQGKSALVEVRDVPLAASPGSGQVIFMDLVTRNKLLGLGMILAADKEYEFQIREVGWLGQMQWAWNASDPTPRIAARLGVLGAILGLIGVALGVIAIYK